MDWPTVVLILGVLAIVAAALVGGRVKANKDGIEYDTEGLLKWLLRAEQEKGVAPPAAAEYAASAQPAQAPPARVEVERAVSRLGRPRVRRVLWVDDHPLNNVFERQALASLGIFTDSYTSNAEARAAMEAAGYDLVISDVSRDSGMESGWDLLADFRAHWPRVPFIFYAGNPGGERSERAAREGAQGITAFPNELLALVSKALSTTAAPAL
ncbi:MAG TPA: response regulator [Longimicrobium sp.]|nr:response regulator [Longimicrobium sp.]